MKKKSITASSTIDKEEELHSRIIAAFTEYFEANQRWHSNDSMRAAMDIRNALSKIRNLSIERRRNVMIWKRNKQKILKEVSKARNSRKQAGNTTGEDI